MSNTVEYSRNNPYIPINMEKNRLRAKMWETGKRDRVFNKPCLSTNGAYLEGWYEGTEK